MILEPNSTTYVCPSKEITLTCNVSDTHHQLIWTVPDAEEDKSELTIIAIFCNNMNPNRRGPYQPALVGCAEGRITSTLTFNVSHEINATCLTDIGAVTHYVTVGPQGMYQLTLCCSIDID